MRVCYKIVMYVEEEGTIYSVLSRRLVIAYYFDTKRVAPIEKSSTYFVYLSHNDGYIQRQNRDEIIIGHGSRTFDSRPNIRSTTDF